MGQLKEGLMACTKANRINFTNELIQRKNECVKRLTEHNLQTPDVIWKPADGEGAAHFSEGDKAKFKLVDTVTYENGNPNNKIIWPPNFTRLSDELVYLATKFLKASERAAKYPYDFNDRGDIREQRVPSGVSPIVWAHGLPFFPVFKGYYILCGREHARWVGWLLNKKEHRTTVTYPMWTIGPVVAPGSAVNLSRTVTRQMYLHVPKSAKDVEKRWEKVDTARDVVSTAHYTMSVVPKTPSKGFILAPIYQVEGYHVRCGPTTMNGGKGLEIGRRTLSNHGVSDFDYDASLKRPYANEENPAAIHSDESDEISEEENSEGTDPMSGMDEDEDDRGDEFLPSEESVEVDDMVEDEEPPKKKLKKDVTASGKLETRPRDSDNSFKSLNNFKKAMAANRLGTLKAPDSDAEAPGSSASKLAIHRLCGLGTTTNVKQAAERGNTHSGVPAETVYKDTAIQAATAVSSSEVNTSTGDIKPALPNWTNIHGPQDHTNKLEPGIVPPTSTPFSSTTKPIDEITIRSTEAIRWNTEIKTVTFAEDENNQEHEDEADDPREAPQHIETDILQD